MSTERSKENYRKELVATIRDLAEDLIEIAPELVGEADFISHFEIRLEFRQGEAPNIKLIREHLSKNWLNRERI